MVEGEAAPARALIRIESVHVSGFRGLSDVTVSLAPEITYLVGENNAGKTSVLSAIAVACGSSAAFSDDLHISADGTRSGEAYIDLVIAPANPDHDDFDDDDPAVARFATNITRVGNKSRVGFRTWLRPSGEGHRLSPKRYYLQYDADSESWTETASPVRPESLVLLEARIVSSNRDLVQESERGTSDWGRVLSDLGIDDADRAALEVELRDLGQGIRDKSTVLSSLREHLDDIAGAQRSVGKIDLDPVPERIEDLGSALEVSVTSAGTKLPLRFQGSGTRSLASLMTFKAMCEIRLGVDEGVRPLSVALVEEPEAHLHPQAHTAVPELLGSLPGQSIVTTHSPRLVSEVDVQAVRVLGRDDEDRPASRSILDMDYEEAEKVRRLVERPFGDLFFARLVLVGDGATERSIIPPFLRSELGGDEGGFGVSIVDPQSLGDPAVPPLIEFLERLSIPWLALADGDPAGLEALSRVSKRLGELGGGDVDLADDDSRVVVVGKDKPSGKRPTAMESLLLHEGYAPQVYAVAWSAYEFPLPDPGAGLGRAEIKQYLRFLKRKKGTYGRVLADQILLDGLEPPSSIKALCERVREQLDL